VLVGCGPGDPELLTLKALRILGQADVVLHDDLLTPEILELIPAAARVECVGKRHNDRQVTQQEINRRLCAYARSGQIVVRLKGGDGAIFVLGRDLQIELDPRGGIGRRTSGHAGNVARALRGCFVAVTGDGG